MDALSGPQRRVYSTIAIVYCTRVAASSLEYLALAMVMPFVWSGDGVLFLAWILTSTNKEGQESVKIPILICEFLICHSVLRIRVFKEPASYKRKDRIYLHLFMAQRE